MDQRSKHRKIFVRSKFKTLKTTDGLDPNVEKHLLDHSSKPWKPLVDQKPKHRKTFVRSKFKTMKTTDGSTT